MLTKFDGEAAFSADAKWIAADGGKKGEWFCAECSFVRRGNGECVLLFSAADGAEIYVNKKLVHRFVIRSYMFDAAYEALDMSSCAKDGKNTLSVLFRDTGDPAWNGVVFEILTNGSRISSGSYGVPVTARRLDRLSPGVRYMIGSGSGAEEYDARKPRFGRRRGVRIVGNLLHKPVEAIHRTLLDPQTEYDVFPERITLRERWTVRQGRAFSLSAEGYTDTVFFSSVAAASDTAITLRVYGDMTAAIDGKPLPADVSEKIKKGVHTLAVAGRSPVFFAETDAEVSDFRYARFSEKKAAPRHYPWNDPVPTYELSKSAKAALYRGISDDIQLYGSVNAAIPSEYAPHLFKPLSASDGLTPSAFSASVREAIAAVGIAEDGGSVQVSPSRYGAAVTFDFGRERIGYFVLCTDAPEDTLFRICLYESENAHGERYTGEKNTIVYISRGGKQKYVSHCRRGFRYAKIFTSVSDRQFVVSASLKSAMYNPPEAVCFTCSDGVLNTVYDMSRDTARVCMLDRYVDCPGFEQNVWTGDARITALINLTGFGAYRFNEEYLELIGQSLSDRLTEYYRTGNRRYTDRLALPCAAFPTYPDGNIPIWSFQWILSVCDHYLYTGDMEAAKRCLPAVEETFSRAEKQLSPRGLFAPEGTWNLIEWANNDLSEYGEVTANNMMLCGCYTSVSYLENVLGRRKKAEEYREKGERLKRLINRYCYDVPAGKYVDTVRDREAYSYYLAYCEHTKAMRSDMVRTPVAFDVFTAMSRFSVQTAVFAILYDIADGDRLENAKKILTESIASGRYVPGTPAKRSASSPSGSEAPGGIVRIGSPFFMFFALDALYKLGEYRLAEQAMRRDWGDIASRGIANCPETFISGKEADFRSSAHGWSASPAYFLLREVLGVKPLAPGHKKFTVIPRTDAVNEAEGSVVTPAGKISVRWTRTTDGFSIECVAPDGVEYVDGAKIPPCGKK